MCSVQEAHTGRSELNIVVPPPSVITASASFPEMRETSKMKLAQPSHAATVMHGDENPGRRPRFRTRNNRLVIHNTRETTSSIAFVQTGAIVREGKQANKTAPFCEETINAPIEKATAAMSYARTINKQQPSRMTVLHEQQDATTKDHSYRDCSRLLMEDLRHPSSFVFGADSAKEPPFPLKLHQILSNPDYQDIVCWLPHGRSWRVLKPMAFEKKVIPLHFRHHILHATGQRVGFQRVLRGPDMNSYYHELFLHGLPHLSLKMYRIVGGGRPTPVACTTEAYGVGAVKSSVPHFRFLSTQFPFPEANDDDVARTNTTIVNPLPPSGRVGGQEPRNSSHLGPFMAMPPQAEALASLGGPLLTTLPGAMTLSSALNNSYLRSGSNLQAGLADVIASVHASSTSETDKLSCATLHSASASPRELDRQLGSSATIDATMKTKTLPDHASACNLEPCHPSAGLNYDYETLAKGLSVKLMKELTCHYQGQKRTTRYLPSPAVTFCPQSSTFESEKASSETSSVHGRNTHP